MIFKIKHFRLEKKARWKTMCAIIYHLCRKGKRVSVCVYVHVLRCMCTCTYLDVCAFVCVGKIDLIKRLVRRVAGHPRARWEQGFYSE